MKTPEQIRNIEFQKSTMGGYKQSDVELFLEEVASQVEMLMRQKADADRKLQEYSERAPEGGLSAAGIQNILVNAQRTADAMLEEAKEQAAGIVANAELEIKQSEIKAKEIIEEAEKNALLLGETAEKEAAKIIAEAVTKAEEAVLSAKESVELQQKLYDRLVLEVSDFRKKAIAQCGAIIGLVEALPDEVTFNMERAKAVLAIDFANPEELLKNAVDEKLANDEAEKNAEAEKLAEEKAKAEEEARLAAEAAAEAERIAAEEAAKALEEQKKAEAEAKKMEEAVEKAIEDISSSSEAPKVEVAFDDNAIPVQAPVKEEPITNMQLSFDDEPKKTRGDELFVGDDEPIKPKKGRISFGIEDDEDDDDEPRLFFKKKKK
jgi:DivIVA domain-containing protein